MKWQTTLSSYRNYLKIERGLSQNSINSYVMDIEKLISFLDENKILVTPLTITDEEIQQFVYSVAQKINPRSQARLISGLKSFFKYLIFEGYRKESLWNSLRHLKQVENYQIRYLKKKLIKLIGAIELIIP